MLDAGQPTGWLAGQLVGQLVGCWLSLSPVRDSGNASQRLIQASRAPEREPGRKHDSGLSRQTCRRASGLTGWVGWPAKEHLFGQQQQVLMFKEKKEWLLAATRLVLKRLSVLGRRLTGTKRSEPANGLSVCPDDSVSAGQSVRLRLGLPSVDRLLLPAGA